MTIHELDALLEQHFPSAPPQLQQGGAGVTTGAPPVTHYFWERQRLCACGCGCIFYGDQQRKYVNDAHKQHAYRQRKKDSK